MPAIAGHTATLLTTPNLIDCVLYTTMEKPEYRQFTVRVPTALYHLLEQQAATEDRSLNAVVRQAIRHYLTFQEMSRAS